MTALVSNLLAGFLLGVLGASLVVGPIAVLVASNAVSGRRGVALAVGAGAAVAEAMWVFAVYLGAASLLDAWPTAATVAQTIGALGLIAAGFLSGQQSQASFDLNKRGAFAMGFGITALNVPVAIAWAAAIAAVSEWVPLDHPYAPAFAGGAGAGVFLWFAVCVALLNKLKLPPRVLEQAGRVAGVVLVTFGVLALISVWRG